MFCSNNMSKKVAFLGTIYKIKLVIIGMLVYCGVELFFDRNHYLIRKID